MPTKSDLIARRDATYQEPPEKRCSTCRYCGPSAMQCFLAGIDSPKFVEPSAVCAVYQQRKLNHDA
jgi:hypothetical protein